MPRQCDDQVGQPHQQRIDQPAVVGRHRSHRGGNAHRNQRGGDAQDELGLRAEQKLAQNVPAQRVGPQRMPPGWRRGMLKTVEGVAGHRVVHVTLPHRCHEYGVREGHQREQADDRQGQQANPAFHEYRPAAPQRPPRQAQAHQRQVSASGGPAAQVNLRRRLRTGMNPRQATGG